MIKAKIGGDKLLGPYFIFFNNKSVGNGKFGQATCEQPVIHTISTKFQVKIFTAFITKSTLFHFHIQIRINLLFKTWWKQTF